MPAHRELTTAFSPEKEWGAGALAGHGAHTLSAVRVGPSSPPVGAYVGDSFGPHTCLLPALAPVVFRSIFSCPVGAVPLKDPGEPADGPGTVSRLASRGPAPEHIPSVGMSSFLCIRDCPVG